MKKIAADKNYRMLKRAEQYFGKDHANPRSGLPLNASIGALRGSSDQAIIDLIVELQDVMDCDLYSDMSDYQFPDNPKTFDLCGEWEYFPRTAERMAEYGNNRHDLIRTVQLAQAVAQNPGGDPAAIARSLGMVKDSRRWDDKEQKLSPLKLGPDAYDI